MDIMGDRIKLFGHKGFRAQLSVTEDNGRESYYVKWREWEIMYHVAPFLTAEEQRRLVGNDTAMIVYHDSDEEFNTASPRSLMTQLFILVQPLPNKRYRIASFSRNALARYPPTLPPSPVFDASTDVGKALLQDFLLASKLFSLLTHSTHRLCLAELMNGYRVATGCPPLNKLFQRPRQVKLQTLAQRYPLEDASLVLKKRKEK